MRTQPVSFGLYKGFIEKAGKNQVSFLTRVHQQSEKLAPGEQYTKWIAYPADGGRVLIADDNQDKLFQTIRHFEKI